MDYSYGNAFRTKEGPVSWTGAPLKTPPLEPPAYDYRAAAKHVPMTDHEQEVADRLRVGVLRSLATLVERSLRLTDVTVQGIRGDDSSPAAMVKVTDYRIRWFYKGDREHSVTHTITRGAAFRIHDADTFCLHAERYALSLIEKVAGENGG